MAPGTPIVISCEPGRDFVALRPAANVLSADLDVVSALAALPSVARSRSRTESRCYRARRVSWGAANVLAALGSLSTVALGYLVYALFVPVY